MSCIHAVSRFLGPLLLLFFFTSFLPASAQVIWEDNFNSYDVGFLDKAPLKAKGWDPRLGFDNKQWRIEDGGNGNKYLSLLNRASECCYWKGCRMLREEKVKYDDIYWGFRFKFDSNFDFKSGGKLNGFIGGSDPSPGVPTDGSKGASVSLMWRKNGNDAYLHTYTYSENKDDKWGQHDDLVNGSGQRINIVRDKWYSVVIRLEMNDMNVPNGKIQVWLDGQTAMYRDDYLFRSKGATWGWHINQMIYFFGGNGPGWAPGTDSYVYMDDWVMSLTPPANLMNGSSAQQSPVAAAKVSGTSGQAPYQVSFNGSDSFDPDGSIVSYNWDFGDGGAATGAQTSHTYTAAGIFQAKLTVTDNDGLKSTKTFNISVTNPPISGGSGTGGLGTNGPTVGGGTSGGGGTVGCDPVPSGWLHSDIGAVGVPGTVCYDPATSTYTMNASGEDIWNKADGFGYIYQPLTGDGEISLKLSALQNIHAFTKAGVMMREDLTAGSSHAMLVMNQTKRAFQYRRTSAAETEPASGSWIGPNYSFPVWLKLTRKGNIFTSFISEDGLAWSLVDTAHINMISTIYMGIAATSHDNNKLGSSVFEEVTVSGGIAPPPPPPTPTPPPAPTCVLGIGWSYSDIGNVGLPGQACMNQTTGEYLMTASGDDIWNTEDEFGYIYQAMNADGEVSVQLKSLDDTHDYAKAGVMMREDLSANSRHAMLVLNQSRRAFQYRRTKGGITSPLSGSWMGPTYTHPVWLKMTRAGNVFSSFISNDGNAWNLVDTVHIPMKATIYVGVAATSHDNAQYGESVYDKLTFVQSGTTPFPVELLSFTASPATLGVSLDWVTATESNNNFFTVERSSDGSIFELLDEVDGMGTASVATAYQTVDKDPYLGLIYYRLTQTDFNGTKTFLSTVTYFNDYQAAGSMTIYPNPVTQNKFQIVTTGLPADVTKKVQVLDGTGRLVTSLQTNELEMEVILPDHLPPGLYHVMIDYHTDVLGKSIVLE